MKVRGTYPRAPKTGRTTREAVGCLDRSTAGKGRGVSIFGLCLEPCSLHYAETRVTGVIQQDPAVGEWAWILESEELAFQLQPH